MNFRDEEVDLTPYRKTLDTPHSHEGKHNRPLWLIWMLDNNPQFPDFPVLNVVCDSLRSAEYHLVALLKQLKHRPHTVINIERIPANHGFGSSLSEMQMKQYHKVRTARMRHFLDKD